MKALSAPFHLAGAVNSVFGFDKSPLFDSNVF